MLLLDTRDVNSYTSQGDDFVPEHPKPKPKDTLSDLVKLLQQDNEREDATRTIGIELTTASTTSI